MSLNRRNLALILLVSGLWLLVLAGVLIWHAHRVDQQIQWDRENVEFCQQTGQDPLSCLPRP